MPLYEYRCTKCGHQFEHIQTFSAPDLTECPVCHSTLERLISAPNMHFIGSGFYETDYKNKSQRGGDSGSTHASTSNSSSGSDSTSSTSPDISSAGPATPKAPAASPSSATPSSASSSPVKGS